MTFNPISARAGTIAVAVLAEAGLESQSVNQRGLAAHRNFVHRWNAGELIDGCPAGQVGFPHSQHVAHCFGCQAGKCLQKSDITGHRARCRRGYSSIHHLDDVVGAPRHHLVPIGMQYLEVRLEGAGRFFVFVCLNSPSANPLLHRSQAGGPPLRRKSLPAVLGR